MDQHNSIIPYQQNGLLPRVSNSLSITNKILAKPDNMMLIPYRKKDKWGFCTPDKKIVIDCEFSRVHRFSEGLASVQSKDGYGFLNESGNFVLLPQFTHARPFKEGFAAVSDGSSYNSWSFIDKNGASIFSNFEYLGDFNDGLAPVGFGEVKDGNYERKYGFIDKIGSIKIPLEFEYDYSDTPSLSEEEMEGFVLFNSQFKFSEGRICLKKNNKYGFYNQHGEIIVPFVYDKADNFSSSLAEVGMINPQNGLDCKSGYIKLNGDLMIPLKYQFKETFDTRFSEGLALVCFVPSGYSWDKSEEFFINEKDERCVHKRGLWEFLSGFSEGLAVVYLDGNYGFIDKDGELVIDCIYSRGTGSYFKFSNGLCNVKHADENWFINKSGEKVLKCKKNIRYGDFHDGLAYCSIHQDGKIATFSSDTKYGYIDVNGTEFWED